MFNRKVSIGTVFFLLFLLVLPLAIFAGGKKEKPQDPVDISKNTAVNIEREPLGVGVADVAAIVNGTVIPLKTYNVQVETIIKQYTSQGANFQESQLADLRIKVIDNLIDQELLYQDAVSKGRTIRDQAIEVQLDEVRGQFPDEETYKSVLAAKGMTEEEVRSNIGKTLLVEDYITGKFGSLITIEDSDSIKFYEENSQYFSKPEQVRASHILIKLEPGAEESVKKAALKKINAIKTRINGGEEFSELARTLSEGPSNVNGGDLGSFGRGQMVKPFEDVVFAMDVGDVSDVVETQFGYHIIKLTSKDGESIVPFEDVKGQIIDHLKQLKMADMIDGYIATIKSSAVIEVLIQ